MSRVLDKGACWESVNITSILCYAPCMARKKIEKNQKDPNVFWMIREKSTGLYYTGKYWRSFAVAGKLFTSHNRLLGVISRKFKKNQELYEVVEFKRVEVAVAEVAGYGE